MFVVFSANLVTDTRIIFCYDFVAPLIQNRIDEKKGIQKDEKRKNSFLKEYLENADL